MCVGPLTIRGQALGIALRDVLICVCMLDTCSPRDQQHSPSQTTLLLHLFNRMQLVFLVLVKRI
jgi:hypothetical protein